MHADCKVADCSVYGNAGVVSDGVQHVETVHRVDCGDCPWRWYCVRLVLGACLSRSDSCFYSSSVLLQHDQRLQAEFDTERFTDCSAICCH